MVSWEIRISRRSERLELITRSSRPLEVLGRLLSQDKCNQIGFYDKSYHTHQEIILID